jgi:hypothetical protein
MMKRLLLPSLLSAAYLLLMTAFFSSDFSKRHTFLADPACATSLQTIERPSLPQFQPVVLPSGTRSLQAQPGGESPESAGK